MIGMGFVLDAQQRKADKERAEQSSQQRVKRAARG